MLQLPNMQDKDFLFNFIDGLPQWAQNELERREVETTQQAIAVAETLNEFNRNNHQAEKKHGKPNSDKGGGARDSKKPGQDRGNHGRHQPGPSGEKKYAPKFPRGCFLCGGPHAMRDCPKAGSLNAICNEYESRSKQETENMGSLQLLNALNVKPTPSTDKGLLYVEVLLNGRATKAMVDTGATHNFITEAEAARLNLKTTPREGWIKTVNATARRLGGVAKGVDMVLGTWKGPVDFSVAPMDDFQVVLGMDFMRKASAFVMPSLNSVCIFNRDSPCMVTGTSEPKAETKQLSAMQIAKGA